MGRGSNLWVKFEGLPTPAKRGYPGVGIPSCRCAAIPSQRRTVTPLQRHAITTLYWHDRITSYRYSIVPLQRYTVTPPGLQTRARSSTTHTRVLLRAGSSITRALLSRRLFYRVHGSIFGLFRPWKVFQNKAWLWVCSYGILAFVNSGNTHRKGKRLTE